MLSFILAELRSPSDRVGAVHQHFAGRSSDDSLHIVVATMTIAVVLCLVLIVLNRIQTMKRRREEREHAMRLQAKTATPTGANLLTTQRRQAAQASSRTSTRKH